MYRAQYILSVAIGLQIICGKDAVSKQSRQFDSLVGYQNVYQTLNEPVFK